METSSNSAYQRPYLLSEFSRIISTTLEWPSWQDQCNAWWPSLSCVPTKTKSAIRHCNLICYIWYFTYLGILHTYRISSNGILPWILSSLIFQNPVIGDPVISINFSRKLFEERGNTVISKDNFWYHIS